MEVVDDFLDQTNNKNDFWLPYIFCKICQRTFKASMFNNINTSNISLSHYPMNVFWIQNSFNKMNLQAKQHPSLGLQMCILKKHNHRWDC